MNFSPRIFNGGFRSGYGRGYSSGNNFNSNNFSALRNPPSIVKNGSTNLNGSQGTFNNNLGDRVCQICFKTGHTTDICCHRFVEDYVPTQEALAKAKHQEQHICQILMALFLIQTLIVMKTSTICLQLIILCLAVVIILVLMHTLLEQYLWLILKGLLMIDSI